MWSVARAAARQHSLCTGFFEVIWQPLGLHLTDLTHHTGSQQEPPVGTDIALQGSAICAGTTLRAAAAP